MRFVISTTGIRVYDEATQLIRDTHPLARISYIMVLHANRKVFFLRHRQRPPDLV